MTPRELIEAFGVLAEAPDGVKRLRELVLQLAVRGKLVPQVEGEEPAGKVLADIGKMKAKLAKQGKVREPTDVTPIDSVQKPFDLPSGWVWSRLTDVGELARGKSRHRPRNDAVLYSGGTVPLVQTGDVARANGTIRTYTALYNDVGVEQSRMWPAGTMCITIAANIGDSALLGFDACFPDSVVGFMPYQPILDARYFDFFIRTAKADLETYAPSTAQKNINLAILDEIVVPLPPLEELARIVAKVDELMAFLDKLEAAQTARDTTRKALRDAALAALREADSPDDVELAWGRIAEQMDELFAEPEDVAPLRQAVLQLAVRGRLVRQVEGDEPAGVVLDRIAGQKAKLRKGPAPVTTNATDLAERLPPGWVATTLGATMLGIEGGWSPAALGRPKEGDEWGVLKVSACSWGVFLPDENKALEPGTEPRLHAEVRPGDFLISRANTAELVGRSVVVETCPPRLMLSDKTLRLLPADGVSSRYLNFANLSQNARNHYSSQASGTSDSMRNVSQPCILATPIPLPPLAEQHRIVAKVDELMALLDKLESRLRESKRLQAAFAAAAVHHLHLAEN